MMYYPITKESAPEYVRKAEALKELFGERNDLFHTSDFFLDGLKKKEMVPKFINPLLCRITEDLVFTQGDGPVSS